MVHDGAVRARRGLALAIAAGVAFAGCGGEGAQRILSGVAYVAIAAAAKAANHAMDDRRDRREARAARRGGPPPAHAAFVDPTMPLNEPGEAPSEHHVAVAFARMRAGLTACAPPNSGRLIIEAQISGVSGEPMRRALYGQAAEAVDPSCIDAQLEHILFAPFSGSAEVYWTLRY